MNDSRSSIAKVQVMEPVLCPEVTAELTPASGNQEEKLCTSAVEDFART